MSGAVAGAVAAVVASHNQVNQTYGNNAISIIPSFGFGLTSWIVLGVIILFFIIMAIRKRMKDEKEKFQSEPEAKLIVNETAEVL